MEPNQIITKMELITPEKARDYLNGNVMNRKINQNVVDFYAKQMNNGHWSISGQTISISPDGVLIDGQHRLLAVIKSGANIFMNVARNVPEESFINYDHLRARSIGDIFHINGISDSINKSSLINAYIIYKNGWLGTAGFLKTNKNQGGRSKSKRMSSNYEILNFYNNNSNLVNEVHKISQNCTNKMKLFTVSKLGAIILFLIIDKYYDKHFVFNFFHSLHSGETDNKSIIVLRNKFIQDISNGNKLSPFIKNGFIKKCWNATVKKSKPILAYKVIEGDEYPEFI